MLAKWLGLRAIRLPAALVLIVARANFAAPPANERCSGAEIIPPAGPFPYLSSIVDIKDATLAGDPPAPSCSSVNVRSAVWYRFTPATTRRYTLSVGTDTATSVLDTVMTIHTSSAGCGAVSTPLYCSDDDSGESGLQSAISADLTANVNYYVLIWTTSLSPLLPGWTSVQLRVSQPTVPTNDTCVGAEIIPGSGPFPYLTSAVDTTLATTTGDPPIPSCWQQARRSVWFKFTPDITATYELTLCTNTSTTIYETLLAVYMAASPCGTFTQVACNHTNSTPCGNLLRSTIITPLFRGTTYYIVGWEGVNTDYVLGETLLQLRVGSFLPPTAATLDAYGITRTGAVLDAFIKPNGAATLAYFQYGLTTNYGFSTPPTNFGATTPSNHFVSPISGLTGGAQYHFRVVASNSIGTTIGTNRSFAWSSASPRLTVYPVTNATFTLRFNGQSSQLYSVETSTNLSNWTDLGLSTELGGGSFQWVGPLAPPKRFYRVRLP